MTLCCPRIYCTDVVQTSFFNFICSYIMKSILLIQIFSAYSYVDSGSTVLATQRQQTQTSLNWSSFFRERACIHTTYWHIMEQELSYPPSLSNTHPTFDLSGVMGRKSVGRNKTTEVALECWTTSTGDDIHDGYSKCQSMCPTRRPFKSPPGRHWATGDTDATWVTGEYSSVQSREIISLVIQNNQHNMLAV